MLKEISATASKGTASKSARTMASPGALVIHSRSVAGSASWSKPIPESVEKIRKRRSCAVVNCAVSDKEGTATFGVAKGAEAMSTLGSRCPAHFEWIKRAGGTVTEITVRTTTLDNLLAEAAFPEIQFITIDVEGHEMACSKAFRLRCTSRGS